MNTRSKLVAICRGTIISGIAAGLTCVSIPLFADTTQITPASPPAAAPAMPVAPAAESSLSRLTDLATQISQANEIDFDALVTPNATSEPIEVSGVVTPARNFAIHVLKSGVLSAEVVANEKEVVAYAPLSKKYLKTGPLGDDTVPMQLASFLRNQVGMNSMVSYGTATSLLTHTKRIVDMLSTGPLKDAIFSHSEVNVDGQVVNHETTNDKINSGSGVTISAAIDVSYLNSPWSLQGVSIKITSPSVEVPSQNVGIVFKKCDLVGAAGPLTDAKQFALALPPNAMPFATPTPQAADEPQSTTLQPGVRAPNFSAVTPSGAKVHLSDYAGKVVVIDLWATWCGPCQMSLPHTDVVAQKYLGKGVVFLPVCVWDDAGSFKTWLPDHKSMKMHFLFDNAPSQQSSFATKLYKVDGIPTQFVIGRSGKITKTIVGYDSDGDPDEHELMTAIDKALVKS